MSTIRLDRMEIELLEDNLATRVHRSFHGSKTDRQDTT